MLTYLIQRVILLSSICHPFVILLDAFKGADSNAIERELIA
jgi:hypothetical protein